MYNSGILFTSLVVTREVILPTYMHIYIFLAYMIYTWRQLSRYGEREVGVGRV